MNIEEYLKDKLFDHPTEDERKKSNIDSIDKLEDFVKEQYDSYLPDEVKSSGYEMYEYNAPSDNELRESAMSELSDYARQNEQAIRNSYAEREKELKADRAASSKLYDDSRDRLKNEYDDSAERLSNDSLKRGLARSSIAVNKQAQAQSAYMQGLNNLINERNQKISAIDNELNSLGTQLQGALDSFKISYAAKLTQRINELKEEREKNKLEALKYNNSLLKNGYGQNTEEDDAYTAALKQQKLEQQYRSSLTAEEKAKIEKNIYDKSVEYLESLPIDEARKEFKEPFFRENLSDYYYYKLYYRYG